MLTLQRVKARESEMKTRGVVKGNTIKLNKAPDLPDGQHVEVYIHAVPEYSGPGQYAVEVSLAQGQRRFHSDGERRYEAVFPTVMYVEMPVMGEELMRAVQSELGDMECDADAPKYDVKVTHYDGPPTAPTSYTGTKRFEDAVRVPPNIYSKDLMRIFMKALGVDESETKVSAFRPFPKRGAKVTNELVNEIREELGI